MLLMFLWLLGRFAELFVDSGGVQLLLSLPHNKHTFVGLSFAFFGMASVPLAVERVVRYSFQKRPFPVLSVNLVGLLHGE